MYLQQLNEVTKTYLYGCKFYLDTDVLDLREAQKYLDKDHKLMLRLFNDDINGKYRTNHQVPNDSPLIDWRWYLDSSSSGYFIYESSRELTKEELDNLGEGTTSQASDGLGEGFEQCDWACYTEYYDDQGNEVDEWDDYEYEEDRSASFNWQHGYKLRPLSYTYHRYLRSN